MLPQQSLNTRNNAGDVNGHCDLWWHNTPATPGHQVGLIGHFQADDPDCATQLLHDATSALKVAGCTLAIGPMDGDSWHSYRATTWTGTSPAFVMEPEVDQSIASYFSAAGFNLHSSYVSAQMNLEGARVSIGYRLLAWILGKRFRVRNLDLDDYDAELARIHQFCCRAFAGNHLYTPINADDFSALYAPLKPHVRPEFVFIAEKAGRMLGLLFAIPDLNQQQRGVPLDRLVFKTLAVAPELRGHGMAFLLMYRGLCAAKAAGYRNIIHALMYRDNRSRDFSDRNQVSIMREYGLFSKEL